MRQEVGSRELKTRLGSWLQRVREGVTLVVTDRGRPVAELRPIAADPHETRLDELAATGELVRGDGPWLLPFEPIQVGGPPLSQALLDDREDRF